MSEASKPSRSIPEIQGEYQQLCTKAGHLQYQVFTLSKDLGILNDTLRELNLEAAKAQQEAQEAEKKASEEAKKEEESKS